MKRIVIVALFVLTASLSVAMFKVDNIPLAVTYWLIYIVVVGSVTLHGKR